jgi:hypothetical protein
MPLNDATTPETAAARKARDLDAQEADRIARGYTAQDAARKNRLWQS